MFSLALPNSCPPRGHVVPVVALLAKGCKVEQGRCFWPLIVDVRCSQHYDAASGMVRLTMLGTAPFAPASRPNEPNEP